MAADAYVRRGETARERFERACFLAAAANIAPIAAPSAAYVFPEAQAIIEGKGRQPVLMGDPYGAAQKARSVFYLTDNAGEIGFDSLLIRALKEMGARVTLAVKEPGYFDDVTMADVRFSASIVWWTRR